MMAQRRQTYHLLHRNLGATESKHHRPPEKEVIASLVNTNELNCEVTDSEKAKKKNTLLGCDCHPVKSCSEVMTHTEDTPCLPYTQMGPS